MSINNTLISLNGKGIHGEHLIGYPRAWVVARLWGWSNLVGHIAMDQTAIESQTHWKRAVEKHIIRNVSLNVRVWLESPQSTIFIN